MYRRRRLVALVALLVVLALLVWGVSAVVGMVRGPADPPSPQADGGAAASAPADPSASGAPGPDGGGSGGGAAGDCQPDDVVVQASTDAPSYGPEANPVLVMTIENTGDAACDVNVGTGEQEFVVNSGEDRIFSTKDCLAEASDLRITMEPGQTETARFTWERVRSAPGCQAVNAKPRPGTYKFTAKLGDRESGIASFELR